MANGIAPVCPVSRDQPVSNQPPAPLLPVTRALDLPSLIQAVNNAVGNLQRLLGPSLPVNNMPRSNIQPKPIRSINIQSDWKEVDRNTNDGFIYKYDNGNFDKSQRLEVTRIYQVEFSASGSSVNQPMDWKWQEQPFTDGALQ